MSKPRRTSHQREIMGIILREAGQGRFLTQTELYPMLSYAAEVTFGALRVSVRFLEEQGMLERKQQGRNRVLVPTLKGYDWFRPARP